MRAFLVRANRFLDQALDLGPRAAMLAAAACLVVTFFFPLWNLTMFAPQYPDGLRLDIYSYALVGDRGGQDLKEINVLNHYIGMRPLEEQDFTEFKWMPFVIGAIALLILRAVVHGTVAALVDASVVYVYFSVFALWSFGYKLYRYGHDLLPSAAVRVDPFTPPMFGYRRIANFEVYSYPQAASYAMAAALLLLALALIVAWWSARRQRLYAVAA
jgi:copper chaperone NosL